jgi:4-aminobutyrate--pyruvate transaminase
VRSLGDSIAFCPPLIIAGDEIDELFIRFGLALRETEAWVERKKLRK